MIKKRYRRQPARFRMFIAILVIIALAAFSVYEFWNVNSITQQNAAQQSQVGDLNNKLQSLQSQYDSLQSDYKALKEKAEATPSPSPSPSPTPSGAPAGKVAYLTFDDGPTNFTPKLLDVLKDNNVKATFFIAFMGEDTAKKRDMLKQEVQAGHTLAVHSWTHEYDTVYANEQAFLDDFNKMKDIIVEATGVTPNLCRFPGGIGNTVSITASGGVIMPTLVKDVENMGFTPFDWNAGGQDAETPYPTADELAQEVIKDAKSHDSAVILLHDTHQFTIDAVPKIIKELRSLGYTFETLTPQSKPVQQAFAKQSK